MTNWIINNLALSVGIFTYLVGEFWTLGTVLWIKIKYPKEKIKLITRISPIFAAIANWLVIVGLYENCFLLVLNNPEIKRISFCTQENKYYFLIFIIFCLLFFLVIFLYTNIFTNKRTVTKVFISFSNKWTTVLTNRNILLKDITKIIYIKNYVKIDIYSKDGDYFQFITILSKTCYRKYKKMLELIKAENENVEYIVKE